MKRQNFLLSILLLFILACSSDNKEIEENKFKNSTLIFGWFADSSCDGSCSQIYKIENSMIYRDIDFNYPDDLFFEGNFQLVTNLNFEDYEVLLTQLPVEILNKSNGYLDCNDCTNDNGGYYLEIQNEEIHKSWRFRNAIYPDYMENYRSLFLEKLADLNSL